MDVANYAALVIDLSPSKKTLQGKDLTGFEIEFTNFDLQITKLPSTSNGGSSTDSIAQTVTNTSYVVEGWESKVSSANAGFGIIIALVILVCLVFGLILFLTIKKQKGQAARLEEIKGQIIVLNKDIQDAQGKLRSHNIVLEKEKS